MTLILHPINPQQRARMPRINNLERIGLADSFLKKVQHTADTLITKGTDVYNSINEQKAAIERAQKAYEDPNYGQTAIAKIDQTQKDKYMLYGSVAAFVVAAFVAKKFVFDN